MSQSPFAPNTLQGTIADLDGKIGKASFQEKVASSLTFLYQKCMLQTRKIPLSQMSHNNNR
jgi:hypothetical protein